MGSQSAPPPDPAQQELARTQAKNMEEQMAMSKETFAWMKDQAKQQQETGAEEATFQRGLATKSAANADQDRQFFYDTTGKQVKAFNDEVDSFNSDSRREQLAGQASADIEGQIQAGRASFGRSLAIRGLNAGSPAALAMMFDNEMDGSLAKAGASTMARAAARQEGLQLRSSAAGLGSQFGGMASSGMSQASGFGMSGLQAGTAGLSAMGSAQGTFNSGAGVAANWGAGANSTYNSVYNQRLEQAKSSGGTGKLLGSLAGAAIGGMAGNPALGASLGGALFGGSGGGGSGVVSGGSGLKIPGITG